jgi:hypothetical protein
MLSYADAKRSGAGHRNDESFAERDETARAQRHALAGQQEQNPRAQSLLQLRAALDRGLGVQSQLALQRALNRRPPEQEESRAAEAPPQRKFAPLQDKPNATGLPDALKAGVEHLSGLALDDVRVHYNSSKPAAVQAHAYARGTDIHVAPGQEKHLPHEAWHVVQQKQGRVKPTLQMKGVAIANDAAPELRFSKANQDAYAAFVSPLAGRPEPGPPIQMNRRKRHGARHSPKRIDPVNDQLRAKRVHPKSGTEREREQKLAEFEEEFLQKNWADEKEKRPRGETALSPGGFPFNARSVSGILENLPEGLQRSQSFTNMLNLPEAGGQKRTTAAPAHVREVLAGWQYAHEKGLRMDTIARPSKEVDFLGRDQDNKKIYFDPFESPRSEAGDEGWTKYEGTYFAHTQGKGWGETKPNQTIGVWDKTYTTASRERELKEKLKARGGHDAKASVAEVRVPLGRMYAEDKLRLWEKRKQEKKARKKQLNSKAAQNNEEK